MDQEKTHQSEYEDRLQRLEQIKAKGVDPYPARAAFQTISIQLALEEFEKREEKETTTALQGRIKSKRAHGSLLFFDIDDGTGKIQLYIKEDEIDADLFAFLSELTDIGDFLAAEGVLTKTKRGEQSLLVKKSQMLAKSLRPLPEKWHGLSDIETRFRKRELDMLANPKVIEHFKQRSLFLQSLRTYLTNHDCVEVETPILQPIPGGAAAQPFVTHHNSLNQDMYLRIAPELYLKRLVVGGLPRVFEVARCFRNEGIDTQHNPEFTQIELYMAYFDYNKLMEFTEKLLSFAIQKTLGTTSVRYQGSTLDFAGPFPRKTFAEVIKEHTGISIKDFTSLEDLSDAVTKQGIDVQPEWGEGKILDELFKKHARPKLQGPLFITHHPLSLSPLAKKDVENPETVERFQLLVCGMELCNGFSELNDPEDQRSRFEEQEKLRSQGDAEAQFKDDLFIESLEHGLPPTAGIGIGIDRFMQVLTDTTNIKEVIFFPTLRNKE